MNREDKFIQSHQPYAVDLSSLRATRRHSGHVDADVTAVWFRRRRGGWGGSGDLVTVACWGRLWDIQDSEPADALAFLAAHTDGRYGGDCRARWDGATLWAPELTPAGYKDALALLRPMLANHPAAPEPYSGWWTFRDLPPG